MSKMIVTILTIIILALSFFGVGLYLQHCKNDVKISVEKVAV